MSAIITVIGTRVEGPVAGIVLQASAPAQVSASAQISDSAQVSASEEVSASAQVSDASAAVSSELDQWIQQLLALKEQIEHLEPRHQNARNANLNIEQPKTGCPFNWCQNCNGRPHHCSVCWAYNAHSKSDCPYECIPRIRRDIFALEAKIDQLLG
jgi:hypothetical protein